MVTGSTGSFRRAFVKARIFQGLQICSLNDGTLCCGIRKRDAELDEIGSVFGGRADSGSPQVMKAINAFPWSKAFEILDILIPR